MCICLIFFSNKLTVKLWILLLVYNTNNIFLWTTILKVMVLNLFQFWNQIIQPQKVQLLWARFWHLQPSLQQGCQHHHWEEHWLRQQHLWILLLYHLRLPHHSKQQQQQEQQQWGQCNWVWVWWSKSNQNQRLIWTTRIKFNFF